MSNATLTSASINRKLQIYNCCASKKGAAYLAAFDNTIPCNDLIDDAELMVGLIDSVVGFIPEGEVISGDQATYLAASVITLTTPATINITIGTSVYPTLTSASSATVVADYINSLYPISFPYSAMVNSSAISLYVSGSDYELSNGKAVVISIVKGLTTQTFSGTLAGGTSPVYQGENCISNGDVQVILDKLSDLCSTPCNDIVNFDNSPPPSPPLVGS